MGLYHLEPRGPAFLSFQAILFMKGMIVGEHNLDTDLEVNPAKEKKTFQHEVGIEGRSFGRSRRYRQ